MKGYFEYRVVLDRQACSDLQALTKGEALLKAKRVIIMHSFYKF